MKAIIEFNLDDPEDKQSYKLHNKASDLWRTLDELSQWIRQKYKYEDAPITPDELHMKFYGILADNNINLSEL